MYHQFFARIFLLGIIAFSPVIARCQQLFSEGIITYKVTIQPPEGSTKITASSGTYTITLKGKNLRKELQLESGFNMVTLRTSDNNVYSLKTAGDKKIAIQLDTNEIDSQYAKYAGFSLTAVAEKQKISGYHGRTGMITYKDGSSTEIVYANDWKVETSMFDRLPSIEVLPLNFTVKTEENIILHFRVKKIEATLVESSNFKIPIDYNIMSNAEYRELK